MSTAASPSDETATLGGYGIHRSSSDADRLEQQVAVRAEPAAEDDERDVGDRRDRDDVQRDPARDLRDDVCGERVARPRRGEDVARRRRAARASSLAPPRPRAAPRRPTPRRRTGRRPASSPTNEKSTSPAAPLRPRWSSPRSTSPAPMPVPIERKRKSSTPPRDAPPLLPERGEVDVVLEPTREPEPLLELVREGRAPRGRRRSSRARSCAARGRRRRARRRRRRSGARRRAPVASTSASPQLRDLRRATRAASAPSISTSRRARTSPREVADRAAQEAAAEVEPERERRLGDRLEEDRAVARAGRLLGGLADEAGVDERLERERDGRLRDPGPARDLGPRDRRARADRLEHRALVQVLEERGERGAASGSRIGISVGILTRRSRSALESLDADGRKI